MNPIFDVLFDDQSLSAIVNAELYNHDFNGLPNRDTKTFTIARANNSIVTSGAFTSKEVQLLFYVKGCTRHEAECVVNRLKSLMQCMNRTLTVMHGEPNLQSGSGFYSGEYDCDTSLIDYDNSTLTSVGLDWQGPTVIVSATFFIANPIGVGSEATLYTGTKTTAIHTAEVDNIDGTFLEQEPVIELTFNSITAGSSPSISLLSGTTLTISSTPVAGDVLVIDVPNKNVTLNDVTVVSSGGFPVFTPTSATLYINDTYTDRDISVDISYRPRYI